MDRNFGIAIALSFAVFILWFGVIHPTLYPPTPVDPNAAGAGEQPGPKGPDGKGQAGDGKAGDGPADNGQAGGAGNGNGGNAGQPDNPEGGEPTPRTFAYPRTTEQPRTEVTLANRDIEVVLSSQGGTVRSVTMRQYRANVGSDDPLVLVREFQTEVPDRWGGAPLTLPLPPLRLRLSGEYAAEVSGDDLAALEWELIDGDTADHSVAFAFALGNGLRIVRRYTIVPEPPPLPEGQTPPPLAEGELPAAVLQHRLHVEVTLENYDTSKLRFVTWEMHGPAGVQREKGQQAIPYGLVGWRIDGADQETEAQPAGLEGGEQIHQMSGGAQLRYAGVCNPYFTAALVPDNAEPVAATIFTVRPATEVIKWRDKAPLNATPAQQAASRASVLQNAATEIGVAVRHESRVPKATGAEDPGRYSQSYYLLVGAKEYELLGPLDLDPLRQAGFFDKISYPMLLLLKFFKWVFGSWGLGVVILTLLVRGCLHPFQKRAQISMHEYGQKMKLIQPELAKIKQIKDVQRQRKAQMELMQKHNVKPPLGCLMMLAQIPVFIAVYQVFLYSVELRHASFLFIADLSQPDHLIPLGTSFTLPFCCSMLGEIAHINVIPILWIILMQLNHKFSVTKIEDMTEQQAQQMKMMRYMTPLFGLMFWNIASAAGLYVIISTTWGMVESRFIRKEITAREEAAKAGLPITADTGDAEPDGGGGGGKKKKHKKKK